MCSNNSVDVVELDYVVLKLNGSDITSLSSYDAVQMFLQAKETLVVELCRKKNPSSPRNTNGEIDAEICAKVNNVRANSASSSAKNQVVLTLRAFGNAEAESPAVVSKETQTLGNFVELKKKGLGHCEPNGDLVQTIADHFIEQEHHLFEQCLEPEIDIEEVTLVKRDSSNDPIGLSVCCNNSYYNGSRDTDDSIIKPVISNENSNADLISDDAEACEDVFISDIQPDSLAERDGRLRCGDQILRVNGVDIKSRKHAEAQIADNSTDVTLLVSRLLYPEDEDDDDEDEDDDDEEIDSNFDYANSFLSDDYTNVVDKLDKVLLTQRQSINKASLPAEPAVKPIKITTPPSSQLSVESTKSKAATEKSRMLLQAKFELESNAREESALKANQLLVKSLPNATKNAKTQLYEYDDCEHIYETIPEDSESEPLYCSPYQSSNYMTAMGSCSSPNAQLAEAESLEMHQQTQRVAQWLGIKSQISPRSVHTLAGRPSLYSKQQHRISNRVYTLRSAVTNTSGSSSSGAGYAENNDNKSLALQQQEEVDNSSSAYNTGGSNNSASPRQNAANADNEALAAAANNAPGGNYQPMPQQPTAKDAFLTSPISNVLMLPFGKTTRILCSAHTQPAASNESGTLLKAPTDAAALALAKSDPKLMRAKPGEDQLGQCPQFNAPNLSRYHFVSSQEVANKTVSVPKPSSILVAETVADEIPMVWKVKRRPDGTRYIVKRPVRSNVSVGMRKNIRNAEITTTEDDTISEVKIGRYWTKEERKRHIERARERRHHQQLLHQQQQQFPTQ